MELLKLGRHFLLPEGSILAVGRNETENVKLERLAGAEDILLHIVDYPGPAGLLIAPPYMTDSQLSLAVMILTAYSDAPENHLASVEWIHHGCSGKGMNKKVGREHFRSYLI